MISYWYTDKSDPMFILYWLVYKCTYLPLDLCWRAIVLGLGFWSNGDFEGKFCCKSVVMPLRDLNSSGFAFE